MKKLTAFLLLVLNTSHLLLGQSTTVDSLIQLNGIEGKFEQLTDGIFPNTDSHLGKGLFPLPDYYNWKRKLSANTGLDYVITFAPIYQINWQNGNSTANIENDWMGKWRWIENEKSKGNISFWLMHVHNFSSLFTTQFSQKEGLSLDTNYGDIPYQDYVAIMGLWWEQSFFDDKLLYRIGHINSNMVWGNNQYINDDRDGFMNSVSASQQGTSWVGNRSLGAQMSFVNKGYYLSIGAQSANNDQRFPDFEGLMNNPATVFFELGWTPLMTMGSGKYSITLSNVDHPSGSSNTSVLVNIRQELVPGKIAVFARYGQQSIPVGPSVPSALTAGVYWNQVFNYSSDAIGVAYINAEASDSLIGQDQGLEAFYRMLLTERLDLTVDGMYFYQKSRESEHNNSLITSIRLRFVL